MWLFKFLFIRKFHMYISNSSIVKKYIFINKFRIYPYRKSKNNRKALSSRDSTLGFDTLSYMYYPNPYVNTKQSQEPTQPKD